MCATVHVCDKGIKIESHDTAAIAGDILHTKLNDTKRRNGERRSEAERRSEGESEMNEH